MATMTTTAPRRAGQATATSARRHGPQTNVNVSDLERWLSVIGGSALGVLGLSQRSLGGLAIGAVGGALVYRGISGHCSVYGALGLNTAGHHGPATSVPASHGVKVDESVTINRPAADLFNFWRNFENLPRIMNHLESVRCSGDNRWHWVARGPLGTHVEWDAEVFNERPNELIAWRSLQGSDVDTAGSVHFASLPLGRGTEVRVVLKYDPLAGKAGAWAARLFGQEPGQQIREDLRAFKALMETGEAPTTTGQPQGQCHR
jgi:uncharacterized membrane protein